ncbi:MAG TPA: bifunctional isocitrate dehydrogenase kinase/phosphatase [Gammaproteobacteria bacterium]|nr:bifunctional isocitrate dehydrogenase kinase/phosphatase [Gammaproteobacteria bacterium]
MQPVTDGDEEAGGEDSALVRQVAQTILNGFNKHYRLFLAITREAKTYFEHRVWQATRHASQKRILFYTQRVAEARAILRDTYALAEFNDATWRAIKLRYITLLYEHRQPELAESFYNSVFTSLYDRRYYNNQNIFVRPGLSTEYLDDGDATYHSFYPARDGLTNSVRRMLQSYRFAAPYHDLERDAERITAQVREHFGNLGELSPNFQVHTLTALFYRNKAAYIIGRANNDADIIPFAIALMNNGWGGVYVDALLIDSDDIANIFSFARAYFMVDTETPSAVVRFLLRMLPTKTAADIYTAIGLQKQGKTEFYRDFLHHLRNSSDLLEIAPGTKGMVMSVFTLPSYPFVFKVINDRFAPPKKVTRSIVKEKYQLVKMHDRVGRMADTLEFSYAAFPRERFSADLLAELERSIAKSLDYEDDMVVIRHMYIERRLEPLNIYLEKHSDAESQAAMVDYGRTVKDLAAANIFPGDLLLKNFGVTRHGRVIFYDYDEIELMTDCRFRKIPPPRFPEDEMSLEPWYSIGDADVFPEEFPRFILHDSRVKAVFSQHHSELFDPAYWQSVQAQVSAGAYQNVFPYARRKRFKHIFGRETRARTDAHNSETPNRHEDDD